MTRFEAATREDARASLVLLLASLTRRHSCRLVRQVGAAQGTWGLPIERPQVLVQLGDSARWVVVRVAYLLWLNPVTSAFTARLQRLNVELRSRRNIVRRTHAAGPTG